MTSAPVGAYQCEEGTHDFTTGCGYVTPEATCDNPNPVTDTSGEVCDYTACYCDSPTVRDTTTDKCVRLEDCPKKEEKKDVEKKEEKKDEEKKEEEKKGVEKKGEKKDEEKKEVENKEEEKKYEEKKEEEKKDVEKKELAKKY
ncbi:UPF0329 protein ECU05_1680/ECU11_0050-like [Maniola jurtina]|uniref:UPF0329 protein ECU05_1680/ECU11_0050-like n=1 Tax=Maniola jurtina TaxID=191418 RepID=UPI001E68A5EC|nr:UPF0329 protein ECU05_1680/ECU11_0050-like [Maniola jurtina]